MTTRRTTKAASVLVLRTCTAEMTSHGGFVWPSKGAVACSDWLPTAECGNGLHGLLWGEGDGGLLDWSEAAKWLVVSVDAATIVSIGGKVKFPRGDSGTATAGDWGTATAGDSGTATAGYRGTATAGDWGTVIIKRWNGKRCVFSVGYVGEDGIEPNVAYVLDSGGKFVRKDGTK